MSYPSKTQYSLSIRRLPVLILVLVAFLLFGSVVLRSQTPRFAEAAELGEPPAASPDALASGAAAETLQLNSYMPIIERYVVQTLFGVEVAKIRSTTGLDQVAEADLTWVKRNGVVWADLEPTEDGGIAWDQLASMDAELALAHDKGLKVILIVRGAPPWAQREGKECGPIEREDFVRFGQFMGELTKRYSRAPYLVHAIELWNEPDASWLSIPDDEDGLFGCWGDKADPYYGGRYYGDMLEVVYPFIKAANPKMKVLVGGLLLDCDPINPPEGKTCTNSLFLEGILRSGSKDSFDGVSFHAYDYFRYWQPGLRFYGNPNWNSGRLNKEPDGVMIPVALKKAQYLQSVLAKYGAANKFLVNSEAALICGDFHDEPGGPGCEAEDDSHFEQTKAWYLTQSYSVAIAEDFYANTWYHTLGWRNSGLLYEDLSPRPAMDALVFARKKLGDASFVRAVTEFPGVVGYVFSRPGKSDIWVLWSGSGAAKTFTLPVKPLKVYDPFGTSLTKTRIQTVTLQPILVEMP